MATTGNASSDNAEFDIIKKPIKREPKAKIKPNLCPSLEKTLAPAWVDNDEPYDTQHFKSQPAVLDVQSRLKLKKKLQEAGYNASDFDNVEQCYSVLRVNEKFPSSSEIGMRRLCDANRERLSSGKLTAVEFNSNYHMFMTASVDTTLALFQFAGNDNPLMVDRVFEKFPISSAKFTNSGEQVILCGKKHFFKVYDLGTGEETRPSSMIGINHNESLRQCHISPKDDICALSGHDGVYLVDLRSYEKINKIRSSGQVESFCFSQNGNLLNTFSDDGSVFIFDLRKNAHPMHRWNDYSCSGGSSIAVSDDCKYIACGSHSGYVNVYTWESVMNGCKVPKPSYSIGNLITGVDTLLFHPEGQMLCLGSSIQQSAVRLFDLDSQRVYANFPACMGRLGIPTSVGFSPHGGFLCVGQASGQAALFKYDGKTKY